METILTLIQQYGLAVVLLVGSLVWAAKRIPAVASRLYSDRQAIEKEEREERRRREDRLIAIVEKNTAAFEQNASAIGQLDTTLHEVVTNVGELTRDIVVIQAHLQLPIRNGIKEVTPKE